MDADVIKLFAFALACLWTRQAVAVLALHVGSLVLVFLYLESGAYYFSMVAAMYAMAAASNIKFLSSIRMALFTLAVLNWWAAVDFLAWPESTTLYYQSYPFLVNAVDMAVLLLLWTQGGKRVIGRFNAVDNDSALPVVACSVRHRDPKEITK